MNTEATPGRPVSRERLDRLFRPRRLAMIGASDRSPFSTAAYATQVRMGAADRTFLVNPKSPLVHGREAVPSCAAIPGGVDCAYVMVPRALVPAALDDAAAAGATAAVVLSSGYAETGEEGGREQAALVEQAARLGILLLGPNNLGFANLVDGMAASALPVDTTAGPVGLVSQSGALAALLMTYAARHGVHFSHVVTTGNEAMLTAETVVDYLIDDPSTRAIAVFAEVIRSPQAFIHAARRAAAAEKALVVLKVGASELSARTAAAHTGALVGDDRVIDAVLRQEAVIRVSHLEELLYAAWLAAHSGPWPHAGVAVASISGGGCDVIADRGAEVGLRLPALAAGTIERLQGFLSSFGHAENPLDVTGAALMDQSLFGRIIAALAEDPEVGFVAAVANLPTSEDDQSAMPFPVYASIGQALAAAPVKGAFVTTMDTEVTGAGAGLLRRAGIPLCMPSMRDAIGAMAGVGRWSARLAALRGAAARTVEPAVAVPADLVPGAPVSEAGARRLLQAAAVPVVPGAVVGSADEAVAAAAEWGEPVAVKVISADILHKTDVGGVRLGVVGGDAVRAAFRDVAAAGSRQAGARVEGVLVTPMRQGGAELLVGVTRDPAWGPILAIALGGPLVEVLADSVLLPLPAGDGDVRAAIGRLRASALLSGPRGTEPADLDQVVRVVQRIAALALALGDRLEALEVNPLRVDGRVVEALDVLVTWRSP